MIIDKRRSLARGHEFTLTVENVNPYTIVIQKEIGREDFCIVYKGIKHMQDRGDMDVEIKEFYPKGFNVCRTKNQDLDLNGLSQTELKEYELVRAKFLKHLYSEQDADQYYIDETEGSFPFIGMEHNTIYAVSDLCRRALPNNYVLHIKEEGSENTFPFVIKEEIGRGGSCIVYKAEKTERINKKKISRSVIIKEFFPKKPHIYRNDDQCLELAKLSNSERALIKELKIHFGNGQSSNAVFYEDYMDQVLPRIFLFGKANNTVYAVSDVGKGKTLSNVNFNGLKLNHIASIMISICEALLKIHANGKLYLDCKPDNFFFFFDEGSEAKVYLFDFDTVVSIDDVKKDNYRFCSASKGWIPPEQYLKNGRYFKPQLMGYHTDIYSVGAVFFWLLTQRKPTEIDIRKIQENNFEWESESALCSGYNKVTIKLVQEIAQKLLQPKPEVREKMFRHYVGISSIVKNDFENLYGLTFGERFAPIYDGIEQLGSDTEQISEDVKRSNDKLDYIADKLDEEKKDSSIKDLLFGTKRKTAITIAAFVIIATAFGVISSLGERAVSKVSPDSSLEIEQQMDDHIILKLANANHQYEVGLENWRRLDYNRAERDITEAISAVAEEMSQAEIEVAKINNSLGCLYLDMGKYEESYDYLNSAYVTFKDEYGEQAPETLATLFSIAQYDYYTGDYDSALKTSQEILDKIGSDNNAIVTLIKHFQASVYAARGYYDQAISIYEDVLELYKEYLKDDALINELASYTEDDSLDENEKEKYTNMVLWIAKTYENIGEAYIGLGKSEKAKQYIDAGLNMCLENSYIRTKHLSTASLYLKRAIVENQLGEYKEAIDDVDLAVRIEKNIFDFEDNYPGLVEAYDLYGVILESQGKSSEAKEYYENALGLAKQSFGENHPQTAEAYYYCGLYSSNEKEYEYAAGLIREAIEIRKNILGEKHPNTIKYYLLLAQMESELGNKKEAQDCIDKADSIKFELGVSDFFGELQ